MVKRGNDRRALYHPARGAAITGSNRQKNTMMMMMNTQFYFVMIINNEPYHEKINQWEFLCL